MWQEGGSLTGVVQIGKLLGIVSSESQGFKQLDGRAKVEVRMHTLPWYTFPIDFPCSKQNYQMIVGVWWVFFFFNLKRIF